ncbi:MAG: hypothetical protein KBT11_03840 [Treponema sp.]|nr:hypothetical protein [Candidatus Treponema equifaecale]
MADYSSPKKPEAKWEPGTLDNTRRNIGPIDQAEAQAMMKKLGGEIFTEKAAPIDYSSLPKSKEYSKRAVGKSASSLASEIATSSAASSGSKNSSSKTGNKVGFATRERPLRSMYNLPDISAKEKALMDRIMMSDDYKIMVNYGLFNFMRKFKKNGTELVRKGFIEYDLPKHIDHLQNFVTTVKSIIKICPETYKAKIISAQEDKFRLLKLIGTWTIADKKNLAFSLADSSDQTTVAMMIPFVKAVYKDLIKIYYLGETKISNAFKEIYTDLIKYPKFDQKSIQILSKTAITEWFYVYSQMIKGLYPLLMRMCSHKFEYFQDFFLVQTGNILDFVGLTKFDLLLPNKKTEKKQEAKVEEKTPEQIQQEEEEKRKAEEELRKKSDIVETGLKLLDNLFPDAGFKCIENFPDMYPYFQPLYQFRDGYNLLAPENPLQVTVTLLRITEDLFQGCRNIVFTEENNGTDSDEKISAVLSEWSVYREVLFEKYYADQIVDFVNNEYSQGDFKSSLFGKKIITSLLWQTKYNFLPHFSFEQLLLEKSKNDSPYKPLCMRVSFLKDYLAVLSKNIEGAVKTKGKVMGIQNPWERYHFDISNPMSKRMDVLLGAKKLTDSAATNANLIKYAYCVISVLDWWVNNPGSPAYATDSTKIYRINPSDGGPAFSAPLRTDQNKMFTDRVKLNIEKQKAAATANSEQKEA